MQKQNKPITAEPQPEDDERLLKLKSLFGKYRVIPEGCKKGPPGGHTVEIDEQKTIESLDESEHEKLTALERPAVFNSETRRRWLTNLDDDDLSGHLLRAGSADASPQEKAASNRALRNMYKNAVAKGVVGIDSMLKDWFLRTSHMIIWGDDELFGDKPAGRKTKNANRDARIADAFARHIIKDKIGWDAAEAAVVKAEKSAGHHISGPRVREIFRKNKYEAVSWVKFWGTDRKQFSKLLKLPFPAYHPKKPRDR